MTNETKTPNWEYYAMEGIGIVRRRQGSGSSGREHIASEDCWCHPVVDYKDPETGVSVFVHNVGN